jgi:hypothetical protein
MSIATVTTMGYSIGGGLQAGPYKLATLGYSLAEFVTAQHVVLCDAVLIVSRATGTIGYANATGVLTVPAVTGTIEPRVC